MYVITVCVRCAINNPPALGRGVCSAPPIQWSRLRCPPSYRRVRVVGLTESGTDVRKRYQNGWAPECEKETGVLEKGTEVQEQGPGVQEKGAEVLGGGDDLNKNALVYAHSSCSSYFLRLLVAAIGCF